MAGEDEYFQALRLQGQQEGILHFYDLLQIKKVFFWLVLSGGQR